MPELTRFSRSYASRESLLFNQKYYNSNDIFEDVEIEAKIYKKRDAIGRVGDQAKPYGHKSKSTCRAFLHFRGCFVDLRHPTVMKWCLPSFLKLVRPWGVVGGRERRDTQDIQKLAPWEFKYSYTSQPFHAHIHCTR